MIFLRNISIDDPKILSQIHNESFDECWKESSFQSMLLDPAFFGFIVGRENKGRKTSCGFILCRRVFEEIEIITFCVSPLYRKMGLGKLLLIETIKQAGIILRQEADQMDSIKIFLEVAENNIKAISLYKAFGFEKISKRQGYYHTANGNIDANVMILKLCSD